MKKNCERRPFDVNKLKNSVEMALRKRPVSKEQVEKLVNGIVRQIETGNDVEITTSSLGEIIMNELKKLDKVAFVRFASVYKNFEKPDDFQRFIKEIVDK